KALAWRPGPPRGDVLVIADLPADIALPRARPLHVPAIKPVIADRALETGDDEVDAAALYAQVVIDKGALARHIRQALQDRTQITLGELCAQQPLRHGLAELVAYLQLAGDTFKAVVDEDAIEVIAWQRDGANGQVQTRRARLPRVIFAR
ncbi:MAG: DUF3375 family protein, partial [Sulfurimicrobium sp.]